MADELRFDGKVAIVTGAGSGLGRAHALLLASRGAKVVVNDLGGDIHGGGASQRAADKVVDEIKAAGGEAVANYDSVENGAAIVKTAVDAFGTVHIVINNAGILRDVSFAKMTDDDWNLVLRVHLGGTYAVTKAAWPYMREQNFGRIVNVTSAAGIYGNFGQANYSAAKLGILGFSNTLAIEGANRGIHVNTIAPIAGSRMTETVLPKELVEALKPEYVSPLVAYLCHENTTETGALFEVGAGWVGKLRWQRTKGYAFDPNKELKPDDIAGKWKQITDFSEATTPKTIQESTMGFVANLNRKPSAGGNENIDVDQVLGFEFKPTTVEYDARDAMIYALGVGAAKEAATDPAELRFTYEGAPGGLKILPTMGVTFPFAALGQIGSVPGLKFNPMMVLHGEQRLELLSQIPPQGKITSTGKVKHVYDKGKGALLVIETISTDEKGNQIARNEFSTFIRGIGGWGGDRGPSGEKNVPPDRAPDAVHEEKTRDDQALLYRLSGDRNPLHADPNMAKMGGFDKPILHGLCTFGFVGRAVLKHFCDNDPAKFKAIEARFAKHVFPGETIVTEMWKEGDKVIVRAKAKERDEVVLSNAAVELGEVPAPGKGGASVGAREAAPANGANPEVVALFDQMKQRVEGNADLVNKIGAVYRFEITGDTNKAWTVDLKNGSGSVEQTSEGNADCTITISDSDFLALNKGELDPQQAFMQGKLQIAGNMMLAQKLGDIMRAEQPV